MRVTVPTPDHIVSHGVLVVGMDFVENEFKTKSPEQFPGSGKHLINVNYYLKRKTSKNLGPGTRLHVVPVLTQPLLLCTCAQHVVLTGYLI